MDGVDRTIFLNYNSNSFREGPRQEQPELVGMYKEFDESG
jgi:hypothetical protein